MAKPEQIKPESEPDTPRDKAQVPAHKRQKQSAPDPVTGLTAKQEAFVQHILNGYSQIDSYRWAYETENMADSTAYVESWKAIRNPKIARRIETLTAWKQEKLSMQQGALAGVVTEGLLDIALNSASDSVRVRALEQLGRTVGLFVDRKETKSISDDTLPELEAKLREKLSRLKDVTPKS